jgi:hypothetical protein
MLVAIPITVTLAATIIMVSAVIVRMIAPTVIPAVHHGRRGVVAGRFVHHGRGCAPPERVYIDVDVGIGSGAGRQGKRGHGQ